MPTTLVEKLTMRPPLRSRRAASRMVLKLPFRLTATCWSKAASSLSAILPSFMMPALLTSTSTPPNAASAASNRPRTALASLTSAFAVSARPPAASILSATAWAGLASPE